MADSAGAARNISGCPQTMIRAEDIVLTGFPTPIVFAIN